MNVIIAGSRDLGTYLQVDDACAQFEEQVGRIERVVSGTARGVDQMGEEWARKNGRGVTRFPANWDRFGKRAGYLRNEDMAKHADGLVAIWDGESRGTRHMIHTMKDAGLPVVVHIYRKG